MKQHKNRDEAMDQKKGQVVLFKPIKHKDRGVMRPGKTKKDRAARSNRLGATSV